MTPKRARNPAKRRLAFLDDAIRVLRMCMASSASVGDHKNAARFRARIASLDRERCALRHKIKKYTGDGVGGSARRVTTRSPGSSPGRPTTTLAVSARKAKR